MQQAYIHFVTRFKLYKKLLPYKCTGIKSLLELAYLLHLSFPKISSYCVQTTTERRKVVMDSKWEPSILASKDLLTSSTLLVHFNPKPKLVHVCNPSAYGIGAVLAHKYLDSSERSIGCFSCSLSKTEKNYSQIEKKVFLVYLVWINFTPIYWVIHST